MTNINTPAYWNDVYRREWETGLVGTPGYHRDYGPVHDAVIELIPEPGRVLDVGCGTGLLCRKVKQRKPGVDVTGVDFSAYTIARNQARDTSLGIRYRCLDVRTGLATVPGPFDVITICEVLEHLDDAERIVASAAGLSRPGGRLIITCPHDDEIPDPEHVRTWGHDSLFHLLASHGDTVSFRQFPAPYFHPWMMGWVELA